MDGRRNCTSNEGSAGLQNSKIFSWPRLGDNKEQVRGVRRNSEENYPSDLTEGYPNVGKTDLFTKERLLRKLKRIKLSFGKAVGSGRRSSGGQGGYWRNGLSSLQRSVKLSFDIRKFSFLSSGTIIFFTKFSHQTFVLPGLFLNRCTTLFLC